MKSLSDWVIMSLYFDCNGTNKIKRYVAIDGYRRAHHIRNLMHASSALLLHPFCLYNLIHRLVHDCLSLLYRERVDVRLNLIDLVKPER